MTRDRSQNAALFRLTGDDRAQIDLLQKYLMHADNVAGLYYPTSPEQQEYSVSYSDDLPVPPEAFWHWYAANEEDYLDGGRAHAQKFRKAATDHGFAFERGKRVLDFGCSGGRVTRWFKDDVDAGVDVWGCDIDTAAIEWCQKNLMPPFNFVANTNAPHLPVPDGFFDFIFAGSVFTHIKDMSAAWGMELARCLSPDGLAIVTITSEKSLNALKQVAREDVQKQKKVPQFVAENEIDEEFLKSRGVVTLQSSPWWLATLYHTDCFIRRMSLRLEVVEDLKTALVQSLDAVFRFLDILVLASRIRKPVYNRCLKSERVWTRDDISSDAYA